MPTQHDVSLLIGEREHADWTAYSIDSDLMVPADAWQFELGPVLGDLPSAVAEGRPVKVKVGGRVVMSGRVDAITHEAGRQGRSLAISGRDGAAVLVDCASPVFASRLATLDEIAAKVVRPLGITAIRIDADATARREKVNVEPGESAWDTLRHAAEANGLWPWFEPDGTLVIGRPTYTQPPVATLKLNYDGRENNLISLSETRDVSRRFSEVTVLGQAAGKAAESGKHNLKATVTDSGVGWYRPRIVTDHEAETVAIAQARGRKLIADARLDGYALVATLNGHAVDPAAASPVLWAPGQRVHLVSQPHAIDAVFFVMARRFTGGRGRPSRTQLTLKEDGVWQLDAHPHQRKHRRGKNSTPGAVVDLGAAT
jgi:prophage tail gpP-like protein